MATLAQSAKKIKAFDFEKEILKVLKDNDNVILDLNTDSQLGEKGIDSKGDSLPGPYAPSTVEHKNTFGGGRFGGITDHVTLYGEGDFHKSFFLDASKFPVLIDAKDSKTSKLKSEWGDDIFGLTDESISELNNDIIDDIQASLKKGIGI